MVKVDVEQELGGVVTGLCGNPNVTGMSCVNVGADIIHIFSTNSNCIFMKLAKGQQLTAESALADDTCQTRDPASPPNAVCS